MGPVAAAARAETQQAAEPAGAVLEPSPSLPSSAVPPPSVVSGLTSTSEACVVGVRFDEATFTLGNRLN